MDSITYPAVISILPRRLVKRTRQHTWNALSQRIHDENPWVMTRCRFFDIVLVEWLKSSGAAAWRRELRNQ